MSAQPWGCDPEASWVCLQHAGYVEGERMGIEDHTGITKFSIKDSGKRHEFASGSLRDTAEGKIKWSRITFGPMMRRWAAHLTKAEAKYPDPTPGVPNFSLISTEEERIRYRESAFRHFMSWFNGETDEDHAAATFFNINGVEIINNKLAGRDMNAS